MIKPVVAKPSAEPDCGCVLYAPEYVSSIEKDDSGKSSGIGFISLISSNSWEAAKRLNVDADELKEQVTYCCPFFPGNKHFWMIPTAIIVSRDIKQYREPNLSSPMFDRMFDATDTLNNLRELNKVQKVMLGHGYTDFTLPSDGDNELAKFTVNLSNGDKLLMAGWVWYNK